MSFMSKTSPLEVDRPWNSGPYQEARPTSASPLGAAAGEGRREQAAAPTSSATAARPRKVLSISY
jgi:hypothetical protein